MHVAIIGNGITGVTAAFTIRRLRPDWTITMISGESTHHWSRPALMYIFMGHMRYRDTKPFEDFVWREERIDLLRDWVTGVDPDARRLALHRTGVLQYDRLLLAVGSKPNRFGWPGQDLRGVQGMYDLMDLKRLYDTVGSVRRGVIVGGGLIGIELGEMLHSRGIDVTFLVREKSYWANVLPPEESAMVNRAIEAEHFNLRLSTELEAILDDGTGRVGAIRTTAGDEIECQFVGLTAGVSPNLDLVRGGPVETNRGILVNDRLETSVPDVWAAGDCAEIRRPGEPRNRLEQVWYTGKAQGKVAGMNIAGETTEYVPSLWYNSAKFLDLEYQTYGSVHRKVPGERNLYWEHPSGRKALRLVHTDEGLIGVNTMGLRARHAICEQWILERAPIERVIDELSRANFDPEFSERWEPRAADAFRARLAASSNEPTT